MSRFKVVHFEIPADDLERAKNFYREVFKWEMLDVPEVGYVIVRTVDVDDKSVPQEAGAINGGMVRRDSILSMPSLSIRVDNIDEVLGIIRESGGTVIKNKTPVGDIGAMAYFKDTEGNILSLWESPKF